MTQIINQIIFHNFFKIFDLNIYLPKYKPYENIKIPYNRTIILGRS